MTNNFSGIQLGYDTAQFFNSSFIPSTQVPSFGYYTDLLAREDNLEEDIKVDLPQSIDPSSYQSVPSDSQPNSSVHVSISSDSTLNPPQVLISGNSSLDFNAEIPLSENNYSHQASQTTIIIPSSVSLSLPKSASVDSSQNEYINEEELTENERLIRSIAQNVGDSLWNFSSNCAKDRICELFQQSLTMKLSDVIEQNRAKVEKEITRRAERTRAQAAKKRCRDSNTQEIDSSANKIPELTVSDNLESQPVPFSINTQSSAVFSIPADPDNHDPLEEDPTSDPIPPIPSTNVAAESFSSSQYQNYQSVPFINLSQISHPLAQTQLPTFQPSFFPPFASSAIAWSMRGPFDQTQRGQWSETSPLYNNDHMNIPRVPPLSTRLRHHSR